MAGSSFSARRSIPSLDRLLGLAALTDLATRFGRERVTEAARAELDASREALAGADGAFREDVFVEACTQRLSREGRASLRPVFNLTGTVLHTNLGRALMPEEAVRAVVAAMTRPVNLEYDLDSGERGERDRHVEGLLAKLTGAEAALVVNNNAAAVYLVLNTLALKKEVPVSRGELVEIGGAFRIPDIMARAGTRLVEVGTTNRTHVRDYAGAVTPRTAALMKVHASNFAIRGFTSSVAERDLAAVAREHQLALISDLGSGTLVDLQQYGLAREPTVRETLDAGVDIVTFSGDKLMGGPQAGLVVGRASLVERIRRNPMKRALRVDKMTLAALEAVLRLYERPGRLQHSLPALKALSRPAPEIAAQAARVLPAIRSALGDCAMASACALQSQIGSGALPVDLVPSHGITIQATRRRHAQAARLAAAFRALPLPVIGRIADGAYVMDLRCLEHEDEFVQQLRHLDRSAIE
jgi:L-seryl-tRNA(Ser) seleniumtransferase